MAGPSQSSIQKLSDRIDELAARLDPNANRELILIVDRRLTELLPDTWCDRVLEKHFALRSFDRNAGKITVVVSSVERDDDGPVGPKDMASRELLRDLRAPRAITHQPQ
jgi:hypothetical protein